MGKGRWETAEGLLEEVGAVLADTDTLEDVLARSTDTLSGLPAGVTLPGRRTMAVGDLHGHLEAALWVAGRFLRDEGVHLVGLGDYVDRGPRQLETLLVMLLLLLRHPDRVTLLRGNHETGRFSRRYGFRDQVLAVQPEPVYDLCLDLFSQLPHASHRRDGVLLLHGGVPSGVGDLDALMALPKGGLDGDEPSVAEVLLNDPVDRPGMFSPNVKRGIGNTFGLDASRRLMDPSGLWLIVRGHEPAMRGASRLHGGRVLTVFSHPDYYGAGNDGAVALIGLGGQVDIERIHI